MKPCRIIFFLSLLYTAGVAAQPSNDTAWINALRKEYDSSIRKLNNEITTLKSGIILEKRAQHSRFTAAASFLDAAISSANNLQSLILKESYRNKIASLNNPTSNELGFNLENEIHNALQPLLDKTRKTNVNKFSQVVGSFLETGKRSSTGLFPAANIFTSIVGIVGNLAVQEKAVDQQDLNRFITSIEKYFLQYERLHQSNFAFNLEMEKLKARLRLLQDDIRLVSQDLVLPLDKTTKRSHLKKLSAEELLLRYFNAGHQEQGREADIHFPADAVSGCKNVANTIQRIYDDYATLYNNNYREIRGIIMDTRNVSNMVDQAKLSRTLKELETLYNESKAMDADNLRLKTLQERVELLH